MSDEPKTKDDRDDEEREEEKEERKQKVFYAEEQGISLLIVRARSKTRPRKSPKAKARNEPS